MAAADCTAVSLSTTDSTARADSERERKERARDFMSVMVVMTRPDPSATAPARIDTPSRSARRARALIERKYRVGQKVRFGFPLSSTATIDGRLRSEAKMVNLSKIIVFSDANHIILLLSQNTHTHSDNRNMHIRLLLLSL